MTPIQNYKSLVKYYGEVGTNQTMIDLPHSYVLAWDKSISVSRMTIHEKCADSYLKAINQVLDHYGPDLFDVLKLNVFGGCLNIRKIRNGTGYSTHSWGIAHDVCPTYNRLRWDHTKALFAKQRYDKWFEIWKQNGWVSLGKERDYDFQHIQRARLK
jgi:hypothetical protein